MAAGGEFEFDREGNLPGGSFSRLLLSDDVVEEEEDCKNRAPQFGCYYSPSPSPVCRPFASPSPPSYPSSSCSSLFSLDTPKMLCFGDYCKRDEMGGSQITSQSVSSSPVSKSSSNASINSLPNSSNCNKRRNGSSEKEASAGGGEQSGLKKSRPAAGSNGSRSGGGHAKAKKREKLGERIAALQQLVSPYGKTDTASVLHETMGYIRFLQDQVKVLCSPYLQRLPSSPPPTRDADNEDDKSMEDLKSKGLCLVPVDGIADMASNNGADFWSPVTMNTTTTSISKG